MGELPLWEAAAAPPLALDDLERPFLGVPVAAMPVAATLFPAIAPLRAVVFPAFPFERAHRVATLPPRAPA